MTFDEIRKVLGDTPYLGIDEGWELYQFILREKPARILELGHAHGVSTLYMAAALEETGGIAIDSVDLAAAAGRTPNLEQLLEKAGLQSLVNVHREINSYTWFLKKKIEEQSGSGVCEPIYDFCFIDGPKNWTIDGLAFFLVEKLLRENGWILFDDYQWTHSKHVGREVTDGISVRSLGDDEVSQPHIERIFKLLIMQHEKFSNFMVQDKWWAWAQKIDSGSKVLVHSKKEMSPGWEGPSTG